VQSVLFTTFSHPFFTIIFILSYVTTHAFFSSINKRVFLPSQYFAFQSSLFLSQTEQNMEELDSVFIYQEVCYCIFYFILLAYGSHLYTIFFLSFDHYSSAFKVKGPFLVE